MAEVRPIPSAVGAFEAQIIDTSRSYNALVQNANALRKQQAELAKETEKLINTSLSDKRTTRPQDNDYLNSLKNDAQTYFSNNKDAVLRGGAELQTLKEKMGKFTSEVGLSNALFRTTNSMAPVVSESLKANNAPSKKLQEVWSNYLLPINDPKRKTYTYKNASGVDVDINQLSVLDLTRYKTLSDVDFLKNIDAVAKNYSVSFKKPIKGARFIQDQTTTFSLKSPLEVAGVVKGVLNDYVNKLEEYTTKYDAIQKSPDLVTAMNEDLSGIIQMYKDASSGAPAGTGFGSIVDIFSEDGVQGINSPYELAVYDALKSNAPTFLKSTYDYSTQNQIWRQMSLDLQRQGLYIRINQNKEKEPLDAVFIKDVNSGKVDWKGYEKMLNSFGSAVDRNKTSTLPVKIEFDERTKTATVVTQKHIIGPDGAFVNNFEDAKKYGQMISDDMIKGGRVDGVYKDKQMGVYVYRETKKYNLDPNVVGQGQMRTNVVTMFDNFQEAITSDAPYNSFVSIRSTASRDVLTNPPGGRRIQKKK